MKPTEKGSAERSTMDEWIDVARRGEPDAAETRRAKMLVASHREAKLEATLMSDFDAARAVRPGDDAVIESALAKVLAARVRSSGLRLRAPETSVEPASGLVEAGRMLADAPSSLAVPAPAALDAMPLEAMPRAPEAMPQALEAMPLDAMPQALEAMPTMFEASAPAPRVASAIATPGPQRAVRVEARKPSFRRLAVTLSAGIALGAGVALVVVQGTGWSIGRDPDHDAAPRAAAIQAMPSREVVTPRPDLREVAAEEALAVLASSRGDHPAARRLTYARGLVERRELERASRVLRVVTRRWPRRAEASSATLALGHVYVALGWPRSAERTWSRWLRAHPHDPHALVVRTRLGELAALEGEAGDVED